MDRRAQPHREQLELLLFGEGADLIEQRQEPVRVVCDRSHASARGQFTQGVVA